MNALDFAENISDILHLNNDTFVLGMGPYLESYNSRSRKCSLRVFSSSRIHGIRKVDIGSFNAELLVFGSKWVSFVRVDVANGSIARQCIIGPFPDWIKDARCFERENGNLSLVIVYAHNFVQFWKLLEIPELSQELIISPSTLILKTSAQCKEKCILYSASIFGNNPNDLLIVSGTVFNQIIIWRPCDTRILRRLDGHEGVLFRVRLLVHDGSYFLTSVSDDRSCMLWKLSMEWEIISSVSFYGHLARVWDGQYLPEIDCVITASEDSTLKIWDATTAKCINTWTGHRGGVWSLSIAPDGGRIASGSVGGDLRCFDLKSVFRPLQTGLTYAAPGLDDGEKHLLSQFSVLQDGSTLASSNHGCVYCFFLKTKPKVVHVNGNGNAYKAMSRPVALSFSDIKFEVVCVANNLGSLVVIVRGPDGFSVAEFTIPIVKHPIVMSSTPDSSRLFVFIADIHSIDCAVTGYEVLLSPKDEKSLAVNSIVNLQPLTYEMSKEAKNSPNISCVDSTLLNNDVVISFGCNQGNIHVFVLSTGGKIKHLIHESAHGIDTITDLIIDREGEFCVINTSGRDGYWSRFKLSLQDGINLRRLSRTRITKGWLERLCFTTNGRYAVIFACKQLVFVDLDTLEKSHHVDFNGGHRVWDARIFSDSVVISVGRDYKVTETRFIKPMGSMADGVVDSENRLVGHAKECRTIIFFEWDSELLIASGGEDCTVKLYSSSVGHPWTNLTSFRKHTSAVTEITFVKSSLLEQSASIQNILMFCVGGRHEMYVWQLGVERGTDALQVTRCFELECTAAISETADTRILGVSVVPLSRFTGLYLVATAYSDSYLRLSIFDETTNKFYIITKMKARGYCLLGVKLDVPSNIVAICTDTRGFVHLWDVTSVVEQFMNSFAPDLNKSSKIIKVADVATGKAMKVHERSLQTAVDGLDVTLQSHRVHQSGIHSYAIHRLDQQLIIVTAGDDGAIGVLRLFQGEKTPSSYRIESAHASAVTAVKILKINGELILLSSSIDERLNVWKLKTPAITQISSYMLNIGDISSLSAQYSKSDGTIEVYVVGSGLQRVKIPFIAN